MRFLTATESLQIIMDRDLPVGSISSGGKCGELQVSTETCLARAAAAARLFVSVLGVEQPAFLWVTGFGARPNLENRHLFDTFRHASGEQRPLSEAPGHLFAADEAEALTSYLQLTLQSGWSAVLLSFEDRHRLILASDGWLSIRSASHTSVLADIMDDFGVAHRIAEQPDSNLAALGLAASHVAAA